jgi:CheY-like chemotaxis protein
MLKKEIEKAFQRKKEEPKASAEPAKKKQEATAIKGTILVAEDQSINMKIVVQLLQRKGYKVIPAGNGKIALETYTSQYKNIDLILMDVQMPEMDGKEATKAIRLYELEIQKHTPIIAMTAHAMKGDKEEFLASGMDDYLSKPILPQKLYEIIEKNLKQ